MSAALYPATDALDECRPLCGWVGMVGPKPVELAKLTNIDQ
ncbi:hypothetical protein L915_13091 [Phytophthora nicotianae]|uniref:Uncharacterized protein n=3 Tax=Phytophthora nicotianae TaxID=4792 RepID=V9ETJ0_PHYNI|nr:hypothetical protein F443_13402 [Phytophthora nicotianae P1569]ETK81414.1 hypothetical protein L915_13091 [Phytophthora nicotianae]ETM41331.1 hypothetical protein L914_12891 [Phytophthora nicotianae]ETO70020.1 hypothetical protein F444_13471 [Phytophthora nicotianae P1976]